MPAVTGLRLKSSAARSGVMLPRYSASQTSEMRRPAQRGEAVEELDELQLIVQVVLEPQHDFFMLAGAAECRIALLEIRSALLEKHPSRRRR